MALNINDIIAAIMEYRIDGKSKCGVVARYATSKEIEFITQMIIDNVESETGLDIVLDDTINIKYFYASHGLILPRETETQSYEDIFNNLKDSETDENVKRIIFNPNVIGNLIECIKVIDSEELGELEGSEQHGRKLQKVSNH